MDNGRPPVGRGCGEAFGGMVTSRSPIHSQQSTTLTFPATRANLVAPAELSQSSPSGSCSRADPRWSWREERRTGARAAWYRGALRLRDPGLRRSDPGDTSKCPLVEEQAEAPGPSWGREPAVNSGQSRYPTGKSRPQVDSRSAVISSTDRLWHARGQRSRQS
jgi:hypothetical protein